jgi:hypothetical protein
VTGNSHRSQVSREERTSHGSGLGEGLRRQGPSRLWKLVARPVEGRMTADAITKVSHVFFGVLTFVRTTLQLARATSPTLSSVFSDGSTLTMESMGAPCETKMH